MIAFCKNDHYFNELVFTFCIVAVQNKIPGRTGQRLHKDFFAFGF